MGGGRWKGGELSKLLGGWAPEHLGDGRLSPKQVGDKILPSLPHLFVTGDHINRSAMKQ